MIDIYGFCSDCDKIVRLGKMCPDLNGKQYLNALQFLWKKHIKGDEILND